MLKLVLIVLAILAIKAKVFPPPSQEIYHGGHLELSSVCNLYHLPSSHPLIQEGFYFEKILRRINKNVYCARQLVFSQKIHTQLSTVQKGEMKSEAYELVVAEKGIEIIYGDYSGYVYALESLSQIVKDSQVPFVTIKDEPLLSYRGIMIDSARHYLSVDHIKRLVQSMPLSKLNVLHWHIVDD